MRLDNVLVCMKRTLLERFRRRRYFRDRLLEKGKESPEFRQIFLSHEQTLQARQMTLKTIKAMGFRYRLMTKPENMDESIFDLAIVVGGDGTMLDYARHMRALPLLGVNSSPNTSVGRFHYTNAQALEQVLDEIQQGLVTPTQVVRLNVSINGEKKPFPALNEVLFAHKNPAATSKYTIRIGEKQEVQRSSGVWVATAAGSSGAIMSAGGHLQDMEAPGLQYRVREKFLSPLDASEHSLLGGDLPKGHIEFIDHMFNGAVFLDGMRGMYETGYWSRIAISSDGPKLSMFLREK